MLLKILSRFKITCLLSVISSLSICFDAQSQTSVLSKIKRISGVLMNTGEVLGIYVSPGLATLIEAPCPVSEVIVGNPKDIIKEKSERNPNDVRIFLSTSLSQSSNLILRCPSEVIVLDLYPSRTTHQDYLKIESTYGGPELVDVGLSPVTSQSIDAGNEIDEKNLILVQESGNHPLQRPLPVRAVVQAPKPKKKAKSHAGI